MPWFLTPESLASFAALTFLEVVLGVDNIVFLALAVERLSPEERPAGRRIGLTLAMVLRVLLLVGLVWLSRLDVNLVTIAGHPVTIKDAMLIAGGLFLLAKGTEEIHQAVEGTAGSAAGGAAPVKPARLSLVVLQIGVINIVFSLDSVITAVGMTNVLPIMIAAVVASSLLMLFAAEPVGHFIHTRPTTKILALSFMLLVGVALVADGAGFHIPRGYIYFAIAFSLFVELVNARARSKGPKA